MDALQGKLQSIRQRQNAVARAPEARAPEARGPHRVSPHEMRTLSRITLLQNGARRGSQEAGELIKLSM